MSGVAGGALSIAAFNAIEAIRFSKGRGGALVEAGAHPIRRYTYPKAGTNRMPINNPIQKRFISLDAFRDQLAIAHVAQRHVEFQVVANQLAFVGDFELAATC